MPLEVGGEQPGILEGPGATQISSGENFVVFLLYAVFHNSLNDSPEIPNTTGQKITTEQNSHGGSDPQTALALQRPTSNGPKNTKKYLASWWFQPLWKILYSQNGFIFPK